MPNSDYRFNYTNDDGSISIVVPTDNCGLTLEEIRQVRHYNWDEANQKWVLTPADPDGPFDQVLD